MGTRSLTFVHDGPTSRPFFNMYRQYDGYPSGHGAELAEFLKPFTMVNGIGLLEDHKIANGAGCLAAQLVAHFKNGPGGFYIQPSSATDCGQDYEYHIYADLSGITLKVFSVGTRKDLLFNGTVEAFEQWCATEE